MKLQIINDCAGTDPELSISGTDPGRRQLIKYIEINLFRPSQYQNTFQDLILSV